jgi:hypothetical protein
VFAREQARRPAGPAAPRWDLSDTHEREADAVAAAADRLLPDAVSIQAFGARFGHDFGNVKVYSDSSAARAAAAVGARAYTIGDGIAVGGQLTRTTLAHELAHVVAQRGGGKAGGLTISPVPHGSIQRQGITPLAPGGGFSGVMERDRQRVQRQMNEMHFFHGTSWEVAKTIPGNVDPSKGGGDFSTGFYTHVDADNEKARGRAKLWARLIARKLKEPYAGVIDFTVQRPDYLRLLGPGKSLDFGLTRRDQPDYQGRQREWLDFVTTYGRKADASFDPARGVWHHERRDPQVDLPYNIVSGPFYKARPGLPGWAPPGRDEYAPYQEGRALPQQVVWANDGAKLLNSNRVRTDLEQYDTQTGDRNDPPKETPPGPAARTPAVDRYPSVDIAATPVPGLTMLTTDKP